MKTITMKLVVGTIFTLISGLVQADDVRVDEAYRLASDGIIKPFDGLNQTAL